jgi:hypothetical protein
MHAAAPMWRNGRRNGLKILSFTTEGRSHCRFIARIDGDGPDANDGRGLFIAAPVFKNRVTTLNIVVAIVF